MMTVAMMVALLLIIILLLLGIAALVKYLRSGRGNRKREDQ